MQPDASVLDPEIAAFIRAQPRDMPYSAIAETARLRFGDAHAPDEAVIRRWWQARFPAQERSKILRDPEVHAAVLDLAGRLTGPEIMRELASRFAASRLPSRSSLYRALSQSRREARAARQGF